MSRSRRKGGRCECVSCGSGAKLVTAALGVCADCIRADSDEVRAHVLKARAKAREPFGLPPEPPSDADGRLCNLCVNECRILDGGVGYCGLPFGGRAAANVQWYYDPLPTNCVADWVCPGGTGCGYPDYVHSGGPEYGYKNLAVFYEACAFDCLFCQNWHYRESLGLRREVSPERLAEAVDDRTACICYFGGDPTPQLPHAIRASQLALERTRGCILRICWETNGSMHPHLLDRMCDLSLASGGCVKFDLKAWSEPLNIALCGVTNRRTLDNFRRAAERMRARPEPPPLVASTLLVPGYVDVEEVSQIAQFVASVDPQIPYSLLAFYPAYCVYDLPTTSKRHAEECQAAALEAGLKRVKIGNVHLLGDAY